MAILTGLARPDEVQRDVVGIGTGVEGLASELGAVVDADLLGRAMPGHELLQHAHY
jgi:hypothetical protein